MGRHYLYRHIRLDTNEVFYVGIGTKSDSYNSYKKEYSRAYIKYNRNLFWKNIVSKTDYEVEILVESDDYEFIKQKEREFIALYGRRDLGKGTLVNLTNGGDGSVSNPKGENHPRARIMLSTQTGIFYHTIKDASIVYGITRNHLGLMLKGLIRNKTDLIYAESEDNGIYPIIPEIKPYKTYVYTEEHKNIISERFKGKWVGGKSLFAKKVINLNTGILYGCIKDAAESSEWSYASLKAKLNPNNNRKNKTPFEYYDEEKHKHLLKND